MILGVGFSGIVDTIWDVVSKMMRGKSNDGKPFADILLN